MKYDLHIHSTVSDGQLDRIEVLKQANSCSLDYIAFTDHNIVYDNNLVIDDYNIAHGTISKTKIIDAIEMDCKFSNLKLHILGYDIKNNGLINGYFDEIKKKNKENITKLIENIYDEYGIRIENDNWDNKRAIISWLMHNGYGTNPHEIADKYTSRYSKCYIPMYDVEFENLFQDMKYNCGVFVLAHPETLRLSLNDTIDTIKKLEEIGLDGVEVLNLNNNNKNYTNELLSFCKKNDLVTTCGSDFHIKEDEMGFDNDISKKLIKRINL